MAEGLQWALTKNFAYRLIDECEGFSKLNSDSQNSGIIITGKLRLGSQEFETKSIAECTFIADDLWAESPPTVICKEPWVTLGKADWHIAEDGTLCWDYDVHWKDCMASITNEVTGGEAAEFGKIWMLRSVRNLLNRHLFARRSGIMEWRKEWDYWNHGRDEAAKEYLKLLRSKKRSAVVMPVAENSR